MLNERDTTMGIPIGCNVGGDDLKKHIAAKLAGSPKKEELELDEEEDDEQELRAKLQ